MGFVERTNIVHASPLFVLHMETFASSVELIAISARLHCVLVVIQRFGVPVVITGGAWVVSSDPSTGFNPFVLRVC